MKATCYCISYNVLDINAFLCDLCDSVVRFAEFWNNVFLANN